jgi:NAD(P)-dependent dehydrogenase (short-subunit alcohol dehydrogenase family)
LLSRHGIQHRPGSTGQIPHLVTERFDKFSVQKSEPGAPYGPSKAALESATVIWTKDLVGTGVTVNALAPGGPANTRMIPKSEVGADDIWPPEPVRNQIERLASSEIERAIQMERFNMRAAHFRGLYEGGTDERNFAKMNYDGAVIVARWPRTAALLRSIGDMWEAEVKRADIEAAQRRLKS